MTQPPLNYPPAGLPPGYPQAPPGYPPVPPGYPPPPAGYYAPPGYRPKPTGPGGAPLAEFGDRLLAYLLDGLILSAVIIIPMVAGIVLIIVAVPVGTPDAPAPDPGPFIAAFMGFFLLIFVVQFLASYLYQVTYQLRRGQTIGKRVMKLRIVDAETGAPMDGSAARKRWIIGLLMGFIGVAHLLDGLWQLWDEQKQTLHDKVARTVVVKVPA